MKDCNKIQDVIMETIQKAGHHPYLFVGSGFSQRYMGYENWENLLRRFCIEFSGDEFLYDAYANQVNDLNYYDRQPKIASLLEKDYNQAVFSMDKYRDFLKNHKEQILKGVSPFKIAIAEHFKKVDLDEMSTEIQGLKKIAVRSISGIITTNYDFILESIFDGYESYIGQEDMFFANFSGVGEIYKIHGSAEKPESIIITDSDYKRFEAKSAYLIAKLLTMFLEYPVIFMGYSLRDRNIRNILRTISDCLTQDRLELLRDRFVFVDYNEVENVSEMSMSFEDGHTIFMNQISTKNYLQIYQAILGVKARYSPRVLRDLRKDIFQMANSESTKGIIYASGIENLDKIEAGQQFVLGIGVQKNGHIVKAEQIYEDVVLDNQYFAPSYVVEEYLPELLKSNSGGLPMYKYLKDYSGAPFERVRENVLKYNCVDSYLNAQLRNLKSSYRRNNPNLSVSQIVKIEGMENAYKRLIFLESNEIDIKDMKNYLVSLLRSDAQKILRNNSELKRLIRIYDFVKYK